MSITNFLKGECSHCAGHFEFPASAAGQIIVCPHCGRQTELVAAVTEPKSAGPWNISSVTVMAILIAVIGLAMAALFLNQHTHAVVSGEKIVSTSSITATTVPADEINTNEFAIASFKLEHATGSSLFYVTGKLRNLAGRQRFGIKLTFDLFDANNMSAGKATDYHQMIEPHTDWTFKALVLDSKAATARFNLIREEQ